MKAIMNKTKKSLVKLFSDNATPFHSPKTVNTVGYSYISRMV